MYHPEIIKLDQLAIQLYAKGETQETTRLQITAGALQQKLLAESPYKTGRRFLTPQWCWAFGHIGLLHMLVRWFKLREPETELILETRGSVSNEYFLKALGPWLTIVNSFSQTEYCDEEIIHNSVYFACPDGKLSIHNFYKQVERECKDIHLLRLTEDQKNDAADLLAKLEVRRPYVALHARHMGHDPARNITLDMAQEALASYIAEGFDVISIGLDQHPIEQIFPSVRTLPNPWLASFLLSASCDRFIGSNSGAWTVAHAYQRPVTLMNDYKRLSWIYPEEVFE